MMDTRVLYCLVLVLAGARGANEYANCKHHSESVEILPGAYLPQCNEAGNYRVKQCHTSTGVCWCVNAISGEEIEGTRVRFEEPNCTQGSACEQEVANTESMPGAYIPQCAEDGSYARVQCHGSTGYCWCAHPETNAELEGTRIRFEQPECPAVRSKCQEEAAAAVPGVLGAYTPQCEEDGSYSSIQCHGSTGHCWCVDPDTNEEKEGTRTKPGEGRPVCDVVLLGAAPPQPDGTGEPEVQEVESGSTRLIASFVGLSALCLLLHL